VETDNDTRRLYFPALSRCPAPVCPASPYRMGRALDRMPGRRLQFRMRRRLGATGATKQLRDFRFVHFDPRVGAARYRAQSAAHLNPWISVGFSLDYWPKIIL